jgi:redox-sensing transcriptional repressor
MRSNERPYDLDSIFSRKLPLPTIRRLPVYFRNLDSMASAGVASVSSVELASMSGVSHDLIRRDLWNLHISGIRGVGYPVQNLRLAIGRVLGLGREWAIGIVGMGNLGRALIGYGGFPAKGFRIRAGFDVDPQKIGMSIEDVPVYALTDIPTVALREALAMAVITTPRDSAQDAADAAISAGITSLLNFAPTVLRVPSGVIVRHVDVSIELEVLAFRAWHHADQPNRAPSRDGLVIHHP